MDLRTMKTRTLAWTVLLLMSGCGDPMLRDISPTGVPKPAPASRPVRHSWLTKPKPAASPGTPASSDVYLLYLVSASKGSGSIPQSPYTQTVTLKYAEPARAIYLMTSLTEPSGQGGSGDRLFLVYTDPAMQDWSAKLAAMLDVPPHRDAWSLAVSSLLGEAGPRSMEPSAAEKILKQLEPLCAGQSDTQHRWPACMFAGRLLDDSLGRPREAAGRFEQAASISLKTSPAWLVARYAQARALRSAGDRAAARTIATEIVEHAGSHFERTGPYREARKMSQAK
jgi:hypothetical protein